jgi:2-oxoglutarate dehydrogenase E2 component (dihydrolipoamide succinyltransferase)
MVLSRHTSAHVTTLFEVDYSAVDKVRKASGAAFLDRHGVKLTYTPFIAQATVRALQAFPTLNASIDGNDVLIKKDIHLGMAVSLEGGLIVPVVKNAADLSMAGLAKAITSLADRARTRKLSPDDVAGGTFTITNPGSYGALFGTPIINQPQVAILGVGGIEKRPVVVNDAIAIRTMGYLALSFDHRLIDGAVADQFLADIKKRLQEFDEEVV